ncbi:hypothetical protein B9479_007255, partial [Cryptococcus floricola]
MFPRVTVKSDMVKYRKKKLQPYGGEGEVGSEVEGAEVEEEVSETPGADDRGGEDVPVSVEEAQGVPTKLSDSEEMRVKDLLALECLKPGRWLNDLIINEYGRLIVERAGSAKPQRRVRQMNSNFYVNIQHTPEGLKKSYESGLKKWTKRIGTTIFDLHVLLFPIFIDNNHWAACAVNFEKRRIEVYDSMYDDVQSRSNIFLHTREYLKLEHARRKGEPMDFRGCTDEFNLVRASISRQWARLLSLLTFTHPVNAVPSSPAVSPNAVITSVASWDLAGEVAGPFCDVRRFVRILPTFTKSEMVAKMAATAYLWVENVPTSDKPAGSTAVAKCSLFSAYVNKHDSSKIRFAQLVKEHYPDVQFSSPCTTVATRWNSEYDCIERILLGEKPRARKVQTVVDGLQNVQDDEGAKGDDGWLEEYRINDVFDSFDDDESDSDDLDDLDDPHPIACQTAPEGMSTTSGGIPPSPLLSVVGATTTTALTKDAAASDSDDPVLVLTDPPPSLFPRNESSQACATSSTGRPAKHQPLNPRRRAPTPYPPGESPLVTFLRSDLRFLPRETLDAALRGEFRIEKLGMLLRPGATLGVAQQQDPAEQALVMVRGADGTVSLAPPSSSDPAKQTTQLVKVVRSFRLFTLAWLRLLQLSTALITDPDWVARVQAGFFGFLEDLANLSGGPNENNAGTWRCLMQYLVSCWYGRPSI